MDDAIDVEDCGVGKEGDYDDDSDEGVDGKHAVDAPQ